MPAVTDAIICFTAAAAKEDLDFIHNSKARYSAGFHITRVDNIRKKIWWLYNDRMRAWKEIVKSKEDELNWNSNCERLIELLDLNLFNHRIMIADLKRNLGKFKGYMAIINEIEDGESEWLKPIFKEACRSKRRMVMFLR